MIGEQPSRESVASVKCWLGVALTLYLESDSFKWCKYIVSGAWTRRSCVHERSRTRYLIIYLRFLADDW